jgi:arylsulfatase A-like enzyme
MSRMEELVNDLMIARSHTRAGEEVVAGNITDIMPGPENTYQSYGTAWANLSNTPFRLYKHWTHEGGVSTPFICHWPNRIKSGGSLRHTPAHIPDIMATIIDVTGAPIPSYYRDRAFPPWRARACHRTRRRVPARAPLFWEHEGNSAVRLGKWKLVREYPGDWELYDMREDRTETRNIADHHPDVRDDLARAMMNGPNVAASSPGTRSWR